MNEMIKTYTRVFNVDSRERISDDIIAKVEKILSFCGEDVFGTDFMKEINPKYKIGKPIAIPLEVPDLHEKINDIRFIAKLMLLYLKSLAILSYGGERKLLGLYHSEHTSKSGPYIELYPETIIKDNPDNFEEQIVVTLLHELSHAVMDSNNYIGHSDKFGKEYRHYYHDFFYEHEYFAGVTTDDEPVTDDELMNYYHVREESMANLITYRILKLYADKCKENGYLITANNHMCQEPPSYRLALYLLPLHGVREWMNEKENIKTDMKIAFQWMEDMEKYVSACDAAMSANHKLQIQYFYSTDCFHNKFTPNNEKRAWFGEWEIGRCISSLDSYSYKSYFNNFFGDRMLGPYDFVHAIESNTYLVRNNDEVAVIIDGKSKYTTIIIPEGKRRKMAHFLRYNPGLIVKYANDGMNSSELKELMLSKSFDAKERLSMFCSDYTFDDGYFYLDFDNVDQVLFQYLDVQFASVNYDVREFVRKGRELLHDDGLYTGVVTFVCLPLIDTFDNDLMFEFSFGYNIDFIPAKSKNIQYAELYEKLLLCKKNEDFWDMIVTGELCVDVDIVYKYYSGKIWEACPPKPDREKSLNFLMYILKDVPKEFVFSANTKDIKEKNQIRAFNHLVSDFLDGNPGRWSDTKEKWTNKDKH